MRRSSTVSRLESCAELLPCKGRYPSSVLHVLSSLSLAGPSMAEREGIECRPENLMPTPAMNVQCNPSLLHALQFAPAERTSTVQAASATTWLPGPHCLPLDYQRKKMVPLDYQRIENVPHHYLSVATLPLAYQSVPDYLCATNLITAYVIQ